MWARVCIDLDHRHNVLGWSVEVHNQDELAAVHVFPCGPFDIPAEVFADAVDWLHHQYGAQLQLF